MFVKITSAATPEANCRAKECTHQTVSPTSLLLPVLRNAPTSLFQLVLQEGHQQLGADFLLHDVHVFLHLVACCDQRGEEQLGEPGG